MKDSVIKVEELGKCYKIAGSNKGRYLSLREEISAKMSNFFKFKNRKSLSNNTVNFWALEGISFNIKKGQVTGLIGRNGAGKSTLLKLLGRITEPTKGRIKVKGRIASLLEVGTGFHPELTGRENIFLSGAILGMKREEVKEYFEEIVQFAGVEKFLDTPVKRYSSGMFVRLGFAIAAHLQSEILLIDEVLAVGDLEFQKKCLGKIGNLAKSGRTVIFVSHNLGAIEQLCNSCIVLDQGKLLYQGGVSEALDVYMTLNRGNSVSGIFEFKDKAIRKVSLLSEGKTTSCFKSGAPLSIRISIRLKQNINLPVLGIVIRDSFNVPIIGVNNRHYGVLFEEGGLKEGIFSINIPKLPLVSGDYSLDIYLGDIHKDFEIIENAINFIVESDKDSFISSKLEKRLNRIIIKNIEWQILPYGE